jgi:hypothetical protein
VYQVVIAVDRKRRAPFHFLHHFEEHIMSTFMHAVGTHVARVFARGLQLLSRLHETIIEVRTQRAILEAELFHGRYRLSSKNDDDLPIVR